MTGMPFVFAVWVVNKHVNKEFIARFNNALDFGVNNIDKALLASKEANVLMYQDSLEYLKNRISYGLDEKKKESMSFFLNKIS
jgi:predicted solute-binding protein